METRLVMPNLFSLFACGVVCVWRRHGSILDQLLIHFVLVFLICMIVGATITVQRYLIMFLPVRVLEYLPVLPRPIAVFQSQGGVLPAEYASASAFF
jgi:lipid-A-disaccharide synthase-like uncharacterized protein